MVTQTTSSGTLSAKSTSSTPPVHIRPAHLTEALQIGRLAAKTYYAAPLTEALSPHRSRYYSHYERGYIHRALTRMLDPRNVTLVAISENGIVGYAQCVRLGEDEGAKCQTASRDSTWLRVLRWMFWVYCWVLACVVGGDKSADLEAVRRFGLEGEMVDRVYWEGFPERRDRWHAQSVVVGEEWQGCGIGKRLVGEVMARAEVEGVSVGLEATEEGERMYRRVGFELLGRFDEGSVGGSGVAGGGVMMWTPVASKGAKT